MPRTPPQDPPRSTLVVVRHGDAGEPVADPARDGKRALSEKGRKQARRAGRALARLELLPRDVWTSHLVRAVETAAVARAEAGSPAPVVESDAAGPDALPERLARALRDTPPPDGEGPLVRWVVGHEPHLSRLLGYLVGAPAGAFDVRKGAVAVVSCDGRGPVAGACRLEFLAGPDAVRAIARR